MAALCGGTLACGIVGLVSGQALASFAISGINPFYFEQRWRAATSLVSTPPPLPEGMRADGSYTMQLRPDLLYGPPEAAATPVFAAGEDRWRDFGDVDPYAEPAPPSRKRAPEPIAMIEPPAALPSEPAAERAAQAEPPVASPQPAEADALPSTAPAPAAEPAPVAPPA